MAEGYITFPAIRFLQEVGAALVMLQYDGAPLITSVAKVNIPSSLRRLQAQTTIQSRLGRTIADSLIGAKIAGQMATLRQFDRIDAASEISAVVEKLTSQSSALELLGSEGRSSAIYWQALADFPLQYGKRQIVPDEWRAFGSRRSTITGEARGAVLPAQATLNYCYGVLASEITIALHSVGLDPALGVLHSDKDNRASLSYDLMEPARPILDSWFLNLLSEVTFSKRDFHEDVYGFIRVTHPLKLTLQ